MLRMLPRFLSKSLSRNMRDTYTTVSIEEPTRGSTSSSDEDEKETVKFLDNGTVSPEANNKLLRQCFLWIVISTIFIFACTTTIVITGTAKCRNEHLKSPAPTQSAAMDPVLAHQKALSMFPDPKNIPKDAENCGPDAAAAIAKGCHLDIVSFTWLKHECYDPELTAEFLDLKEWDWALDANGTARITKEQILAGEIQNGFVTFEYHITHCLYTWKKLVRHLERGGPMDWYVISYAHTRHCSKLLLAEGADRQEFNSEFFVQYPMCG